MNYDWIIILGSVYLSCFLIFNGYWVTVFIGRIQCYRKYKRGAARCMSDEQSSYLNNQICYHYETEIWKCVYLIAILLLENLAGVCFHITNIISHHAIRGHTYKNISLLVDECSPQHGTIEQYHKLIGINYKCLSRYWEIS